MLMWLRPHDIACVIKNGVLFCEVNCSVTKTDRKTVYKAANSKVLEKTTV